MSPSQSVIAARAVLKSSTDLVPVHLLNTGEQPVIVYKGTKLGELEDVDEWQIGTISSDEQVDPVIKLHPKRERFYDAWLNP